MLMCVYMCSACLALSFVGHPLDSAWSWQDSMDRDVFYLVEGLSSDDPEIIMSSSWSQPPSPKSLSQGMLIGQELGGDARGIQQSYWPFMFVIRSIWNEFEISLIKEKRKKNKRRLFSSSFRWRDVCHPMMVIFSLTVFEVRGLLCRALGSGVQVEDLRRMVRGESGKAQVSSRENEFRGNPFASNTRNVQPCILEEDRQQQKKDIVFDLWNGSDQRRASWVGLGLT